MNATTEIMAAGCKWRRSEKVFSKNEDESMGNDI
jgi:hypothetical protein